ncbi:MAG: ATP-binding domain-containing protein, partial [Muribaculaceae bacterium]|nr:ATP-binding domain-containing protein [Muribaculaceae bacterium]
RMLLIGDEAQLPPVGQLSGTAMNFDRLRALGLDPVGFTLDTPVRQASESGIIHNANYIRRMLMHPDGNAVPEIDLRYPDVEAISSRELDEYLSSSWAKVGEEETLIITRSNKRANEFNQAIRRMVMFAEEPLERGDRLVISKNDYFWSKRNQLKSFIANGDTAEVTWVGKTEKAYGRYFTDVELRLISDDSIVSANIMLRSLVCDGPSIPKQEMEKFYDRVTEAYSGAAFDKIKGIMEDPYFNALQAKYAYCVTCHKAQGGQWRHIYIDMGGIAPDIVDSDFYRWLYTAITRATEKVFFINPTLKLIE